QPPGYVQGVGTSIVGVVGEFEFGPTGQVIEVGSTAEFAETFGGYGAVPTGQETTWRGYSGYRALAGKSWPAGLRVHRLARADMAKATGTVKIPGDGEYRTLTVTAAWKGNYGNNITVSVDAASDSSLTDGFRVRVAFR